MILDPQPKKVTIIKGCIFYKELNLIKMRPLSGGQARFSRKCFELLTKDSYYQCDDSSGECPNTCEPIGDTSSLYRTGRGRNDSNVQHDYRFLVGGTGGCGQLSRTRLRHDHHGRDDVGDLIAVTAAEIRRLPTAFAHPQHPGEHYQHWSRWRRHHQAQARQSHYQRRLRNQPLLMRC